MLSLGAVVIVLALALLNTLAYRTGITRVLGATIINTIFLQVKTTEMILDMRRTDLRPSRQIGAFPP